MAVAIEEQRIVHAVETTGHVTGGEEAGNGVEVIVEHTHLRVGERAAEDVEDGRPEFQGVIGRLVDAGEHFGALAVVRVLAHLVQRVL